MFRRKKFSAAYFFGFNFFWSKNTKICKNLIKLPNFRNLLGIFEKRAKFWEFFRNFANLPKF